jgi:hypothetical protein
MAIPIPIQVPATPSGPLLRLIDHLEVRFFPGAMDPVAARWIAALLIWGVTPVYPDPAFKAASLP